MPLERAQQQVESDMNTLDDSIQVLKGKAEEYERIMSELKVHLKNKFKVMLSFKFKLTNAQDWRRNHCLYHL